MQSSGTLHLGADILDGKYAVAKSAMGNALNRGKVGSSDNSITHSVISAAQVTVGNKTTDTSQAELKDSQGKTITTDTSNTHRALQKADVAGLQELAQEKWANKMLAFKTASAFNDEAYRTMYKAGAQMYRVSPGCSDQSCAVPLTEKEAMNLKTSEDGKIHLSNNGIFNDLDGAVKYAQQHRGTMNPDGSKDYSNKPEYQYPRSNSKCNTLSHGESVACPKPTLT